MREITAKYANECRHCGAVLDVGSTVAYERGIGTFCPPCAPTDPDMIRSYRAERADRKADRLEEWAEKRRAKASALYNQGSELRQCHAFNTQPGHIPERARMIRREEKAFEHSNVASNFEDRADRLRSSVRVAGDAERQRQAYREAADAVIGVGDLIDSSMYGHGIVRRVNAKTFTVAFRGGEFVTTIDKSWARLLEKREPEKTEAKFKPGDAVVCTRLLARYRGTVKRRTSTGYSVEYTVKSARFGDYTKRETFAPGDVFATEDDAKASQQAQGLR